jgi:hypothetical protein
MLNIAPTPAIGAPTFGVSAPGPVAAADALMIVPVSTSILAHRLQAARQRLETHIFKIEHPLAGASSD